VDARLASLVLVPILLGAFLTFDQLVRRQYVRHRAAWERDGAPRGLLWHPQPKEDPEGRMPLGGSSAPGPWLLLNWVCRTPTWIASDPVAVRLVRRLRALVVIGNVGAAGAFASQFLG
jgi:hypothetical protein